MIWAIAATSIVACSVGWFAHRLCEARELSTCYRYLSRRCAALVAFLLLVVPWPCIADDSASHLPDVGVSVVLDARWLEHEGPTSATTFYPTTDRFFVRAATLDVSGRYGEHLSYSLEAGTAACTGSTSFQLLEAGVMYELHPKIRVGLRRGHVMRGYAVFEECTDGLTAEKPVFVLTLSPCHPTGFVTEFNSGPTDGWGMRGQLGLLNGAAGSLEGEHDYNIGILLETPVEGLSAAVYYNDIEFLTGELQPSGDALSGKGMRAGLGFRLDRGLFLVRAEHYWARGFPMQVIGPAPGDLPQEERLSFYEDREMRAWYVQAGIRVPTGLRAAPAVVPYCRYQSWDKDSKGEGDAVTEYVTVGVAVPLSSEGAKFRIDYEVPVATPSGSDEEAGRLIARLQVSI